MTDSQQDLKIPFNEGDWIQDKNNPSRLGQYTGKYQLTGPRIFVQLSYPGGSATYRPLESLTRMAQSERLLSQMLLKNEFSGIQDLRRLITNEKLKGTLNKVIYSMDTAQIDFYPYQFKPVLKFIDSPTERLIIADEVGLGKTIESALIWIEMQSRKQAQRLLIICPKTLAQKWQEELRTKFLIDAKIVDFNSLRQEYEILKKNNHHSFVLITTYTNLRPPKSEKHLLDKSREISNEVSKKTKFLREILDFDNNFDPFDLVIFDEAHYMRNPATSTFSLGKCISASAGAVLCVSATPINNSNTDLHSLIRLIDEDFFETQSMFDDLLEINRPTVQASNALSRIPIDIDLLKQSLIKMENNEYVNHSPYFNKLKNNINKVNSNNKELLAQCQDLAEKLNLLGRYINRTRRVHVKEYRAIRDIKVLTIQYNQEEMSLYNEIVKIVKKKCQMDNRPFYIFKIFGLQLRAASCLPVIAKEIKDGHLGDIKELLQESMGEEQLEDIDEEESYNDVNITERFKLSKYDFTINDSKYIKLKEIINQFPDEKIIIFSYYRATLSYLQQRLEESSNIVSIIHGGMKSEERWEAIDKFKDPKGSTILLSSEVGSEGIDLQFCSILVNYDLPWNPMRIEQRIGRIDRIGQQAKKLIIINFKVENTIEERLYNCLHKKLERFTSSLGDVEAIIGQEVQQLTINLLSKQLTPEEEENIIEQSERAIEQKLIQMQALEESGDSFLGLSDYIQTKIEEDRKKGRYISSGELEEHLLDFFNREFQGCEINENTPEMGFFNIKLTNDAHQSFTEFSRNERSSLIQYFQQNEFNITFNNELYKKMSSSKQRSIHFINHLSPFIRWITNVNRENEYNVYKISAISLDHSEMPPGNYCYRVERWNIKGLLKQDILAYGIKSLNQNITYLNDDAESYIYILLRQGKDWDYPDLNRDIIVETQNALEKDLDKQFSEALDEFEADNSTAIQIKKKRVETFYNRQIEQHKQRLETLKEKNPDQKIIRAVEGRLKRAEINKEKKNGELENKENTDPERIEIAAGIFQIISSNSR